MNAREKKIREQRLNALIAAIASGVPRNAESLSKSYGLPQPDVDRILKGL